MSTTPSTQPERRRKASAKPLATTCDGCGQPLGTDEAQRWTACLDCTRARMRTALSGRCTCGKHKVPGEPCRVNSRSWIPCRRCLGSIRQLT
ncbi:MAG TPA: hypothetical protein PLS53_01310 [Thermoanaerobaculaceae bacterium]|nr:hypothetical protein [Thermoanaerobaculaceae bacterium]HPS76774.1 hypothetical protein [Thermoanaerobaculaceae bacterium]